MIQITQQDFNEIGQLATHCDNKKLQIAVNEAITFDMEGLLCGFWDDVEQNWTSTDDIWTELINGTSYEGCGEKTRKHLGLKKVLLYYAYARYVVLNNWNDTANGHVTKTNDFSIPKPLKELEAFSSKYRSMGYKAFKGVQNYLCLNSETYPEFNTSECEACGCNGECDTNINTKGFGITGKNISKWDV